MTTTITVAGSKVAKVEVPLTTVFTPPASCSKLPFTFWNNNGSTTYWRNAFSLKQASDADCYPTSFYLRQATGTTMEYSPGVCPTGYHAAEIVQSGSAAPITSFCCPSGFAYYNGAGCYSRVTTTTNVVINSFTTTAITTPFTAWDWHVQAVWQSTDLGSFTPASAPLLAAEKGTTVTAVSSAAGASLAPDASQAADSNGSSTSSSSSSTTTATANASSGLSGGAIAGIVIGAIAGVALLFALVFFLLYRRKKKQQRQSVPPAYTSDTKYSPVQQTQFAPAPVPQEQGGVNELPAGTGHEYRPELAGGPQGTTAELDGGYYGPNKPAASAGNTPVTHKPMSPGYA
ncbi:hypothetical protein AMS68_001849 [Peltaster fructicola]|uniref:Mid2 domain-containing protein n=1 Tax=Peltaster fructicola TaxID=286661 RepID=A0A6H0XNJ7_9PEZI|nr:hypothetical protein AMS68_001849 [Peltaster fructicola]